jgi:hypothetical protein
MTDRDRLALLEERLRTLRLTLAPAWQRSILAVAREAIEAELTAIGQRMRRDAWLRREARRTGS